MEKIIEVSNLRKSFGDVNAVDNISFDVRQGSLFAFLGTNGAGKSTTINILCTILKKTGGDVSICGYTLGKEDDKIRDSIGIVFQNSVLDNKLTVQENLMTRGSYYGLSGKQTKERLSDFWEQFELGEIWKSRYESLSGGQRRRVDIIRALLNKPKVLFLDEPTTGLDPKSRKLVWNYIDYLKKDEGMTIFLTTHYMEETKDADQVVILEKGNIIANDTPQSLKTKFSSSRLVWYADNTPENDSLISDFTFSYDADHYNVLFAGNDMKQITEFLYLNRAEIMDYEVQKGSMDDVFLNLTGRELEQ